MMKDGICTAIGVVGSVIASLFGGWDAALVTLVIFMAIDYVTGLLVAGVFHNSGKTENGALESRAGWKGLCRKCITLLMVLVATRLDLVTGTNFIRDAVVIAFIANEKWRRKFLQVHGGMVMPERTLLLPQDITTLRCRLR